MTEAHQVSGPDVDLRLPDRRQDDRLFAVLTARRTTYAATTRAVSAEELATVLGWACGRSRRVRAYGRDDHPLGIAPMPGGIDALRTWVLVQEVEGLARGLRRYDPDGHRLADAGPAADAQALRRAATQADLLSTRAAVVVLAVDPRRSARLVFMGDSSVVGGRAGTAS